MNYTFFSETEQSAYSVCFLVPIIRKDEIKKAYLENSSLDPNDVLVINLHYSEGKKKTSMAEMRQYITEELAPTFADMKVKYVLCADGEYFKALTKASKIEANLGYVMDSPFGDFKVIYIPNFAQIFYDPEKTKSKIGQAMQALTDHKSGNYIPPGDSVIKFAAYPDTDQEIEQWLVKLLENHKILSADIEAFSLKHYSAGIGTITFCWNQGEGIAFAVDYVPYNKVSHRTAEADGTYGFQRINLHRRALLKRFFELAREMGVTIMWHSIGYDVYVLID